MIDKSEPKGIVAYQQISRQDFEPLQAVNESMITPETPTQRKEEPEIHDAENSLEYRM